MLWRPESVDDLNAWKEQFLVQAVSYARDFSLRAPPSTTWAGRHSESSKDLILKLNKHPHRFAMEVSKREYQSLIQDMGDEKLSAEYVVQMSVQILQERKDRKSKRGRKHLYLNLQMELLSILLHLRTAKPIPESVCLDILKKLLWGDDSELAQTFSAVSVFDIWWTGRISADVFTTLKRLDLELRTAIVSRILDNEINFQFRNYTEANLKTHGSMDRGQFFSKAKDATFKFQKSLNEGLLACAKKRPLKCAPDKVLRHQENQASCVANKVNFCGSKCEFYKIIYLASEEAKIMTQLG